MDRIDLELKLKEIDPSSFQRLGDYLLEKEGNTVIPFGNCEGKKTTRKGTPDSYILNEITKTIIFNEYTVHGLDLDKKIISDVNKCIEKSKQLKEYSLTDIFYFVNSNNVDSKTIDSATKLCLENGIRFRLFAMFNICELLYKHKSIVKEMFNDSLDDDLIMSLDDFIDYTKSLKGVDHSFKYIKREDDESELLKSMNTFNITLLTGAPGVGKSMLAIQAIRALDEDVFCVRTSNENSLDSVVDFFKKDKQLVLFIDDVNEISSFARFLKCLKNSDAQKLKILCTIREYALPKILSLLNEYSFSSNVIKINRLGDDAIKTILTDNLGIKNELWLSKIASISRGNPRLAIMAGNVAKKDGVKYLIDSKTIMRKYFDIATDDTVKQLINEYYRVLGFIAFVKKVDLAHLSSYANILKLFGVFDNDVTNCVQALNSSELISLYEDVVAQIEDQNLSDYIVEKVLIDLRCCSICDLVTQLIKTNQKEIVESLNIILGIYSSETSRQYVHSEIMKAWEALEKTAEFDCFVKVFYSFDIPKALLYIKSKITSSYTLFSGDYNQYETKYHRNDYVDILSDICKSNQQIEAFQLLLLCLDYEELRSDAFDVIKKVAIIKKNMFTKEGILNEIPFTVNRYKDKPWFDYVLLNILQEGLKFRFEQTLITNDNKMEHTIIELNDNICGLSDYRKRLWNLSLLLTDDSKYKLIFSFREKYPSAKCKETFNDDVENINLLISVIEKVDILSEELFKVHMLNTFENVGINSKLLKIHNEDDLERIIFIIDPKDKRIGYQERKNRHEKRVLDFANQSEIGEIEKTIVFCENLRGKEADSYYKINNFLSLLIYDLSFEKLDNLLNKSFFALLSCDTKCYLLDANYKKGNISKCTAFLSNIELDSDIIEANFFIFNRLEKEQINSEARERFMRCFRFDLKLQKYGYRRTDTLYRFSKNDSDFIKNICFLVDYIDTNPIKFNSWTELLFNEYCFKPDELIHMFVNHKKIRTLEKIILYYAQLNKSHIYSLSEYIFPLARFDIRFFNNLTDDFMDYRKDINIDIYYGLWKQNNCFALADAIFDRALKNKSLRLYSFRIEHVFVREDYTNQSNQVFLEWALSKIDSLSDEESIDALTSLVSKCSGELVIQYYVKLIEKKISLSLFRRILSYPNSYSWTGSEVGVYTSKISKLESVLSSIPSDMEYLEYKMLINEYIKELKILIKEIRISEKMRY